MHEAQAAFQPVIHCTPPTDPVFLASVSCAYGEATEILSSDAAVLVGTLIRVRTSYPMASIIPLSLVGRDAPFAVWLVSRDGWTEIEPVPSVSDGVARNAPIAGPAALPRA